MNVTVRGSRAVGVCLALWVNGAASCQIKGQPRQEVEFESWEQLKSKLAGEVAIDRFAGVVLVEQGDDVVFFEAMGQANRRFGADVTSRTRFNIGSIGKLFTSIVTIQLVSEGKLALDSLLSEHLPELRGQPGERVTVRHVLQHRSGWGHYWKHPTFLARWSELKEQSDYVEFLLDAPLAFAPGADRKYSNVAFELLGGVIERLEGKDFYSIVKHRVFDPARMQDALYPVLDAPGSRLATGYTVRATGITNNTYKLPVRGTAGGGAYTTAMDLLHLMKALRAGVLMPANYADFLMEGSFAGDIPPTVQGFSRVFRGGGPGVSASMVDLGSCRIVCLCNLDPPAADRVLDSIAVFLASQKR